MLNHTVKSGYYLNSVISTISMKNFVYMYPYLIIGEMHLCFADVQINLLYFT